MATFPALAPVARSYSFGAYPATIEASSAGDIRFLHDTTNSGHTLTLQFQRLTEAEVALIRTHYRTQDGGHRTFALSSQAWAGHTSQTDLVPSTTLWRYAAPPDETHSSAGFTDVSISLVSSI
jgi:hypothetical protein